jgi:peptidyl-tRNA hydrolase
MRTDVPDYMPGKAMAQANHAGTQFVGKAMRRSEKDRMGFEKHFLEWYAEAQGFGTCIVLGCTHREMLTRTAIAAGLGLTTGTIHDPTYPIRDGHMIKTLPIDTCSYVFGRKSRCNWRLTACHFSVDEQEESSYSKTINNTGDRHYGIQTYPRRRIPD